MDCRDAAEKERDTVISLRRHFHENPELSQKEFRTMDFIEKFLHELGIETVRVPHGGVFGFIDSGRPKGCAFPKTMASCMPAATTDIWPCC